jgi:hypothetical protein
MADSPVANWLLYGSDTPVRDFLTNDAVLQDAQYFFTGVAAGALAVAAAAAAAEAVTAASLRAAGQTAIRLLNDTSGSARLTDTTIVKGGLTAATALAYRLYLLASNSSVANDVEEVIDDAKSLAPEVPSMTENAGPQPGGPGQFLADFAVSNMSSAAAWFQQLATGVRSGFGYYVYNPASGAWVQFDGWVDGTLLEVKYYADNGLFMAGARAFQNNPYTEFAEEWAEERAAPLLEQALRQVEAADGVPIEWRVAGEQAAALIQQIFNAWNIPIRVVHF